MSRPFLRRLYGQILAIQKETADHEDASVLAPIRRLPAGILAEIFLRCIRWFCYSCVGLGASSFWRYNAGGWPLPLN